MPITGYDRGNRPVTFSFPHLKPKDAAIEEVVRACMYIHSMLPCAYIFSFQMVDNQKTDPRRRVNNLNVLVLLRLNFCLLSLTFKNLCLSFAVYILSVTCPFLSNYGGGGILGG